jgi:hypothetical protein
MTATSAVDVVLEFPFDKNPDLTRDFSLVAWAEKERVDIVHQDEL